MKKTSLFGVLLLCLPLAGVGHAQSYEVERIELPGAIATAAMAMNSSGTVVGQATFLENNIHVYHGFLHENGVTIDLGKDVHFRGINNLGQAVGMIFDQPNSHIQHFVYRNGEFLIVSESINGVVVAGEVGGFKGINDAGQIIGHRAAPPLGDPRPIRLDQGMMHFLDTPPGFSQGIPSGINQQGIACGTFVVTGTYQLKGVLWELDGSAHPLSVPFNRHHESSLVFPLAMNDCGLVVGCASRSVGLRAVVWRDGQFDGDLGVLPGTVSSRARSVNDSGTIVGECFGGGVTKATIWKDGSIQDLNEHIDPSLGYRLRIAQVINQAGAIAGSAEYEGRIVAVILRPQ